MIELTETEKVFILVIKGHFSNYLNNNDKWEEFFEPVYRSLYGTYEWDTYRNYELTLFRILFNLYWKIKEGEPDKSVIMDLITSSFLKNCMSDRGEPLKNLITELCRLINFTNVLNDNNTEKRFDLDITEKRKKEIGKSFLDNANKNL